MTPHRRSIFQVIASLTVFSCGYLLTPNRAIAEPDAMFQPILGEIRDRLPEGMVMRLPSEIEVIGVNGDIPLYAEIISSNSSELLLGLHSQADCQAHFCQIGSLSVSKPDAADRSLEFIRSRISSGSPITLKEGVAGTYIYVDLRGASSRPYNAIIWEQDGLTYVVSLPSLDRERDKENIINIAKSMANELPIFSRGDENNSHLTLEQSLSTSASRTFNSKEQEDYLGRVVSQIGRELTKDCKKIKLISYTTQEIQSPNGLKSIYFSGIVGSSRDRTDNRGHDCPITEGESTNIRLYTSENLNRDEIDFLSILAEYFSYQKDPSEYSIIVNPVSWSSDSRYLIVRIDGFQGHNIDSVHLILDTDNNYYPIGSTNNLICQDSIMGSRFIGWTASNLASFECLNYRDPSFFEQLDVTQVNITKISSVNLRSASISYGNLLSDFRVNRTAELDENFVLRQSGRLENGDLVMNSDESLFDRHSFVGERGQPIKIEVTSSNFDTYLILFDADGNKIAENDDAQQNTTNSSLEFTLPETGNYTFFINGYDKNSRGDYLVSITTPEEYATVASNSSSPTEPDAGSSCPSEMFEARVETSAEYDHQSPSYAGANRAGRNNNGRRNDGSAILPESRCLSLVEIQSPNNPQETWVVIHGWDDSPDGALNALAREVAKQNPRDRVLMLDWSEASNNLGDDDALKLHEKLSRGNYYAATWIRPVAEVTVEALKQKYGIDNTTAGSKLNFIGHSLGSLMSGEMSRIYKQSNGVGSNYLIALDPPSEFNVSELSPIGTLGGYDLDGRTPAYRDVRRPSINTPAVQVLDREILPPLVLTSRFETRTLIPQNVERPQPFRTVSRFSRAFVGKTSFAGNQEFAATAHESFQMDFGRQWDGNDLLGTDGSGFFGTLGTEHGLTIEAFREHISGNSLIPGFLGLDDRQKHSDFKENAYFGLHEGIISISESNEFFRFSLESPIFGKVTYSEDELFLEENNLTKPDVRVAGGSLVPPFYEIFPSILPFANP